jgi:phosphatidylserine decarboxylase
MITWASALQGEKKSIQVVDRTTGQLFEEVVFSEDAMRLFYGTELGRSITGNLLSNTWLSKVYGAYNDSTASRHKIAGFVRDLSINLDECEKDLAEYHSFNEFFARKLKAGARTIDPEPQTVASPGDGRILVFPEISKEQIAFVKWAPVPLMQLFGGNPGLAHRYDGGSALVLRLCPADYHRFHFPVAGRASMTRIIDGPLHSVSPYALETGLPVYCLNKRTICELETDLFRKVLCLEVGALFVGSIVQTYRAGMTVAKGDEKGFFKFGGSTVICFFEPGTVTFDSDLVTNSTNLKETLVHMGTRLAIRTP